MNWPNGIRSRIEALKAFVVTGTLVAYAFIWGVFVMCDAVEHREAQFTMAHFLLTLGMAMAYWAFCRCREDYYKYRNG
jgi:hypothetical protein